MTSKAVLCQTFRITRCQRRNCQHCTVKPHERSFTQASVLHLLTVINFSKCMACLSAVTNPASGLAVLISSYQWSIYMVVQ